MITVEFTLSCFKFLQNLCFLPLRDIRWRNKVLLELGWCGYPCFCSICLSNFCFVYHVYHGGHLLSRWNLEYYSKLAQQGVYNSLVTLMDPLPGKQTNKQTKLQHLGEEAIIDRVQGCCISGRIAIQTILQCRNSYMVFPFMTSSKF